MLGDDGCNQTWRSGIEANEEGPVTYYKYWHFLEQQAGPEYDATYEAGVPAPYSGIYHCEACGGSIASLRSCPLPSQDHHRHSPAQGRIRWQLIVKSHCQ